MTILGLIISFVSLIAALILFDLAEAARLRQQKERVDAGSRRVGDWRELKPAPALFDWRRWRLVVRFNLLRLRGALKQELRAKLRAQQLINELNAGGSLS